MSLVGSLEDLGLGDILQIVSLSRKSGLLLLRSDSGEGRIVLCDGLVRGATIKGGFEDQRGLLVGGGFLSGDDYDDARATAEERGVEIGTVLAEVSALGVERLEWLRREHVERAVMRMFTWRAGEFSFEVRDTVEPRDAELLLPTGINIQYLAMEATRLRDEESHGIGVETAICEDEEEADDEPLFSGEELDESASDEAPGVRDPVDALALATAQRADGAVAVAVATGEEDPGIPHAELVDDDSDAICEISVAGAAAEPEAIPVDVGPTEGELASGHVVAVDPDLAGLEWFKATLEGRFERIHIFQRSELAVDRIRHYLGRGILPLFVVSARTPVHPATGATDLAGLIGRLRNLAPRMRIAALCEEGAAQALTGVDATLYRPRCPGSDPEEWGRYEQSAGRLRSAVDSFAGGSARPSAPSPAPGLARLRQVSDRLRDPSTQGEVISMVLAFASEILSRVVIFMIREEVVVGMAQVGLGRAGGPGDAGLHEIELERAALPELFERVIEARRAQTAPLAGANDRSLAERLGSAVPAQAYAAPIESGGCVVALLYGDNLPGEAPVGDTTALEIVLHEAGLALDRALLERALAEAEAQ